MKGLTKSGGKNFKSKKEKKTNKQKNNTQHRETDTNPQQKIGSEVITSVEKEMIGIKEILKNKNITNDVSLSIKNEKLFENVTIKIPFEESESEIHEEGGNMSFINRIYTYCFHSTRSIFYLSTRYYIYGKHSIYKKYSLTTFIHSIRSCFRRDSGTDPHQEVRRNSENPPFCKQKPSLWYL